MRDLLARVPAERPRAVVDLGCGPGNLTALVARRWPDARVYGWDSSPEMIARAAASDLPAEFTVGDIRRWRPEPEVDVVISNAALQWVPGHTDLLRRWAAELSPGAWLAIQVPGNADAPSHRALREVAADPAWRERLTAYPAPRPVPDAAGYADVLIRAGCAVDAWETTYVHLLPATGPEHPVLRWLDGTALRPVRAALRDRSDIEAFRRALAERLATAYPVTRGRVTFPFRRIFAVARTAARRNLAQHRPDPGAGPARNTALNRFSEALEEKP